MRLFSSFLSTFLIPLVAVMPLQAEMAASLPAATSSASATIVADTLPGQSSLLKIRLADDSKATVEANSIVNGYSVMVTDSGGLPVPDAAVAIRLPDEGATGFFVNGEHSAVAYTNASGVAKFPQVNWGSATGGLSIRVTAVKGEQHAGALIEQTIVAPATSSSPAAAVAPFPSKESAPAPASKTLPAPEVPAPTVPISQLPEQKLPQTANPVEAKNKTPGVPTSVAAIHSGAAPDQQPPVADTAPAKDSVSVVNTSGSKGGSGMNKKWVILAAVIAAGGVGAALALTGKGGGTVSSTAAPTSTTIGAPTVSIGH